ncbi:MAG: [FeFe] hydrogenase H-cluster radical SAM maturase HydE [Spirochaetes bacterium GWD1_61_31]|nr:MAG: [FeFe] hydrogenase H-cluster radical SAM maturase HydE [Spirochaetes bacterium GWB1_60_80]OHD34451.1 MAG: [FeFe] hydrogenase H-cluster radical SAM maturase HydE [Spirochaetes bacterium GWC1_61_12]OHD38615.1 MAG: [FeFe] hydrogenase H-cluster radical SAM maturase HydE [Spirochaetes bacterium GWD1_61_31]OHD43167.1 MAG: [FeFe] hydrogenase H-cluster radical SAM maturase HydE [Spirochaetes bacterium GWE1_60_18]OHD58742.1 MAG: [FeFe] hydrogenase H-cluster radical SAM maturase HydE [Spirochaete
MTRPKIAFAGIPAPLDPAASLALADDALFARAAAACRAAFGAAVYLRGLIEVSNRCVRNCLYCGIRRGNQALGRYGLTDEAILAAVASGFAAGLRSFVLQGAEDPAFPPQRLASLVEAIKQATGGQAAVTFSFGTLRRADYALLRRAGVDRYLMRFETADPQLHQRLRGSPLADRLRALDWLRELDYEVGSGFMTGLPGAKADALEQDVALAQRLQLDMVGVGPFIPHPATPLGTSPGQGLQPTLRACAALRLALPLANLPATTAAGSVAPDGRERMLAAGANVLMPNVGPVPTKKHYELYPGKICLDEDGLTCLGCLSRRVQTVGKQLDLARGDSPAAMERRAVPAAGGQGGRL